MKRIILLLFSVIVAASAFSQKGKVTIASTMIDNGDLATAQERINEALANETTKTWPKTYIVAAKLATAQYKQGAGVERIIDAADYYFQAAELDQKGNAKGKGIGKFAKELKLALTFFMPDFQNAGIDAFNEENFDKAATIFEKAILINKLPLYEGDKLPEDSVFIYYTALASFNAKSYEKAEQYFNQSIDLNFQGGDAILLLNEIYKETGADEKIVPNLKRGVELYPDDQRQIIALINYYLESEQSDDALTYLDALIENNPTDGNYFYVRGFLYDKKKEYEKAEADYTKAVELRPDFFDATLNLGYLYYNIGVDKFNAANEHRDMREFEKAREDAEEYFRKALPFVEKAHELKPEDPYAMETLKTLYYRFNMNDKYDEIDAKLKSLSQE